MKLIVLLSLVASSWAGTGKWAEMRVKYGPIWLGNDNLFLWKVPLTISEANSGRWKNITLENDLNAQFVGVSDDDYGFNPIYDSNGFLAGAQLCQPKARILETGPKTHYPPDQGTIEVKSINSVDYFCSTFLTIDPSVLRAGGRKSAKTVGDGLWLRDTTDTITGYRKIPDDTSALLEETLYKQKNCFPAMGNHYFYNSTMDFDCNKFFNWFLLGQGNDVTGLGWQIFGKKTVVKNNWYDFLPRLAAEIIAPNTNECLYDWVSEYSLTSVHVFFTKKPWSILCPV